MSYRVLLQQQFDIRLRDLQIRKLEVHEHLPHSRTIHPHRHQHGQVLIYLDGCGEEEVGGQTFRVEPGTLVGMRGGEMHRFERKGNGPSSTPVCLVLDVSGSSGFFEGVFQLPVSALHQVRHLVSKLSSGHQHAESTGAWLRQGGWALWFVGFLLDNAIPRMAREVTEKGRDSLRSSLMMRLENLFDQDTGNLRESASRLARKMGYQQDHLNRVLKKEAGVTILQIRDQARLRKARQVLRETGKSSTAAFAAGFDEASYFSRWFKKQTGMSPTEYLTHLPQPQESYVHFPQPGFSRR